MKTLAHPYTDLEGGKWLRGNLHTHTMQSDGTRPPQAIIDDYAARGYNFLALSDHDIFTSADKYRSWDSRGMVMVPGNEIAGGSHLLHIGGDRPVASRPSRQEIINEIVATGHGFVIVNHPNWEARFDHATMAQLREWTGYSGIEIYNGVIAWHSGSSYATDKWDMLLGAGRRVWGFANDDSHGPQHVGMGWNMVCVREPTADAVVSALARGRFYASTGVTLRSIRVSGLTVRIETDNATRIVAVRDTGRRLTWKDATALEVTVPDDAGYVRFECWGTGEQRAWTQPFFVENAGAKDAVQVQFIDTWQISPLDADARSMDSSPARADALPSVPLRCYPFNPGAYPIVGFVDVRPQVMNRAGVVYLRSEVKAEQDGRGILSLGYDGPIRVWMNGTLAFDGPGTNPAEPDRLKLYVPVRKGTNPLLIALDSNGGNAWGLFARFRMG